MFGLNCKVVIAALAIGAVAAIIGMKAGKKRRNAEVLSSGRRVKESAISFAHRRL